MAEAIDRPRKTNAQRSQKEFVLTELNNMFEPQINRDVIVSVAASLKYDLEKCSNVLLELSQDTNNEKIGDLVPHNQPALKMGPSASMLSLRPKSKKQLAIEHVQNLIAKGFKVLVLLRGLPGSGKTFLANQLVEQFPEPHKHIYSTDNYFMQLKGGSKQWQYRYNSTKLEEAHAWNHQRVFEAMAAGISPVIIDNTNTKMWEMKPYATMAIDYGYFVQILEPDTYWCFNLKELYRRNQHEVPKEKLEAMLERYEKNITAKHLLQSYHMYYNHYQMPPQMRMWPPIAQANDTQLIKSQSATVLNSAPTRDPCQDDEDSPMIDLMEFGNNSSSVGDEATQLNQTAFLRDQPNPNSFVALHNSSKEMQNSDDFLSNGLNAWGLNAVALKTWGPLNESNRSNNSSNAACSYSMGAIAQTHDVETSTQYIANTADAFCILEAESRDINAHTPHLHGVHLDLTKTGMVHKKTQTTDEDFAQALQAYVNGDDQHHLDELVEMFPKLRRSSLKRTLHRYGDNLKLAVESLLETTTDLKRSLGIAEISDSDNDEDGGEEGDDPDFDLNDYDDDDDDSSTYLIKNASKSKSSQSAPVTKRNTRSQRNKARSLRAEPSCVKADKTEEQTDHNMNKKALHLPLLKGRNTKFLHPHSTKLITLPEQDDMENECMASSVIDVAGDTEEDTDYSPDINDNNTVELHLDEKLVSELEYRFSGMKLEYPKGMQPVIQVPISLARELYMSYVESVYRQWDAQSAVTNDLIREDEMFARKLQQQDDEMVNVSSGSFENNSSNEIDFNDATMPNEEDNNKQRTFAMDLMMKHLNLTFTSVRNSDLQEILHAHEYSFKDTLETIMTSVGERNSTLSLLTNEMRSLSDVLQQLHNAEFNMKNSVPPTQLCTPQQYRQEADQYLDLRRDFLDKAQQMYEKQMFEVSNFYTQLAQHYTRLYDQANGRAAVACLQNNATRLDNFYTIDLHYLYVKEALEALDMFIDRNVNLLRQEKKGKKAELMIITGRGNNSVGGRARIKPAVIHRLQARGISCTSMNPGLLRIKVTQKTAMTNDR